MELGVKQKPKPLPLPAIIIGTMIGGSCSVGSIQNLGTCTSPEQALALFCKQVLGGGSFNHFGAPGVLACNYLFTAGPEVASYEKGGSHHSKDHWPRYGTEFAQYLLDNKLGEVVTFGPRENRKHHPGCTAQAWLWGPDQNAVVKWWTKYQELHPETKGV